MATDITLSTFDTSNYTISWSKDKQRGYLTNGDHQIYFITDPCKVNFGFRDSGRNFTMMIVESSDNKFIGVFNKIKAKLEELLPDYPLRGFINYNDNSISILMKVPIDNKRRVQINIYDDEGKLINDKRKPSFTVEDLRSQYNMNNGLATIKFHIPSVSVFNNAYYVSMFVNNMTIFPVDDYDNHEACEIGSL